MTIMLTPDQISLFWEAIKFSTINAEMVEERFKGRYLNKLLCSLLAGKAQCFVRLSNERKLQALAITKIMIDELSDTKTLFISALYSFEKVQEDTWKNDIERIKSFAIAKGCDHITCWTISEKVKSICKLIGMVERSTSFILSLNGGA